MNKIELDIVNVEGKLKLEKLDNNKFNILENAELIININDSKFNNYEFNLKDNAYLEINKMYSNSKFDEEVTINLNGIHSKVIYNFAALVSSNEQYTINVNHNNKETISNVINHSVVLNDSKLDIVVNSRVGKGNVNSVLNQETKIITMGKNNSNIKPNLFIDEFNVDARHSASIGKFSKDDIFYLMTKGIHYKSANELLIKGFLEDHLNWR